MNRPVTDEELAEKFRTRTISPLQNVGEPCFPNIMGLNPVVAVGPEHAQLAASAGWTKDDFRQALWNEARVPLDSWPKACQTKRLEEKLGSVDAGTLVPLTSKPEQLLIAIAGGAGKHSHYFPPFPECFTVSTLVRKWPHKATASFIFALI